MDRGSVTFALRCRCPRPRSGPADEPEERSPLPIPVSGGSPRTAMTAGPTHPGRSYAKQPSRQDYWHSAGSGRSQTVLSAE